MGDIFRRMAVSTRAAGRAVPEAVVDGGGRRLSFAYDSGSHESSSTKPHKGRPTRRRRSRPKEDEIRRSTAGSSRWGAASFENPCRFADDRVAPTRDGADDERNGKQNLWAHRVERTPTVKPGATLRVFADLLRAPTAPRRFPSTRSTRSRGASIFPRQAAHPANDHLRVHRQKTPRPARWIGARSPPLKRWKSRTNGNAGRRQSSISISRTGARLARGKFMPAPTRTAGPTALRSDRIGVARQLLGSAGRRGTSNTTVPSARRVVVSVESSSRGFG